MLSCPNPIDAVLARKVEDKTPPAITILLPDPAVKNYFGSEITITGIVTDFADSTQQVRGSVKSLTYEEQYNKRIHGSVTPAADGSFSFSFSTIDPEMLSGTQVIVLTAVDWNENKATDFVTLYDKTSGPIIVVFDHGPTDYNVYSSALNAAMTITGRVELPTTILTYDVEPAVGSPISGQNIAWDPLNGYFQFNFNPVAAGISGQLRFVLKAFDGKDSSTVFILTDDPVAPQITSGTVAADNGSVNLTFSEGVYHTGGADPILADFALSQAGGTASAVLSELIGAPAAGTTSINLGLTVTGTPSGGETITISGVGLTDRVGNPLSPASISRSLHDKAGPVVQQVSSTLPYDSACNAGDVVPVTVSFNEPVTVSSPLAMDLNVGAAASYSSGDGTSTITLNYTVLAGHNADPLNYTSKTALTGAAADEHGNPAVLTLPDPPSISDLATLNLRIDTAAPAAPAITIDDFGNGINKAENQVGVNFTVTGEADAAYVISLTNSTLIAGSATGSLPPSGSASGFALRAIATGTVTVSVTLTDSAGNSSSPGSGTSEANLTAPKPPVVTGASPTNDLTPTWSWSSGGDGGIGIFRYRLDNSDLSGQPEKPDTSYTHPGLPPLSEVTLTMYVQERNAFGNWSDSGRKAILVDAIPPNQPSVVIDDGDGWINIAENSAGVPFTVTGESGASYAISITNGKLISGSATGTLPKTGFVLEVSASGTVTVSVTLTDPAGNSSLPGTHTSEADLVAPGTPTVTVTPDPPDNKRPTWSWTPGGGGNGTFRRHLDLESEVEITPTPPPPYSFAPTKDLSSGDHIMYVRERDAAGNWSEYGESPPITTN